MRAQIQRRLSEEQERELINTALSYIDKALALCEFLKCNLQYDLEKLDSTSTPPATGYMN